MFIIYNNIYIYIYILITFQGDSGGPIFYFGALIGLNVGVYPNVEDISNEDKLNAHLDINLYRVFIDCHLYLR
jgi:hypothetical protein